MSLRPLISKQFHLFLIGCVLAALLLPGLMLPGGIHSAHAVATKIMPLGDSITGSTCWRAKLWDRLQTSGYTNIDFVGTLNTSGCGLSYDGNNEGHGGYLVTGVANQNLLPPWLSATNPDIVLMHFGTNDVWNQVSTTNILAAYSTLVDQMRANNPNMKIIVAQIIPMDPSGCSTCYQGVINLNNAIPGWASGKSTGQSPIYVVDQWTGFDVAADTVDRVHPNDTTGSQKMSDKWYPTLTSLLTTGPTPTRTNTPPPPTATPVGTVTVDDSVQGTGQNQFNYVGTGWSHCTNCNEGGAAIFYNSSQSWNNVTNSYVTMAFTGTQIKYYAVKAPDVGMAAVSIDGGAETNIDLYLTPKTGNVLVWTSATLTNGSHTFKVRNTGTKNASSSGITITLDRVDILSSGPTATPTLTNTPVPPTATWTNTPSGPTNTPTRTNTPVSNLLTNPGFESGTTGWICNGCTGSAVTSPVFAGAQAYQAAARTAAWAGPLQDVTSKVVNGQVRTSEAWVRLASGTVNARITLELTTSTGMTWITLAPNTAVNSTGWTKVSGSATVSWSGTLNTARWFVETDTGTPTLYIDDAKMN